MTPYWNTHTDFSLYAPLLITSALHIHIKSTKNSVLDERKNSATKNKLA